MSKIILDSNTYTHLFKGDGKVEEELNSAQSVYMSVIVMGELLAAFKGGEYYSKNKVQFERFLDKVIVSILDVGQETAKIYGEVKNYLNKKGTPIPANDLWIASQAIEVGAVLITYDRHFLKIPGLRIWDKLNVN
ncbi:MAG: type II toxin-antitoxin system VapC family toxin [Patescibacteria group bacterium]